MGCALLMVPGRPLPNVSLVSTWPLRHGPNAAVAINAADLARGHEPSFRRVPQTDGPQPR